MALAWRVGLAALLAGALCLVVAGVLAADKDEDEDEQEITLDQCPEAVQKTLNEQAQGGVIDEIEKETEDGEVVYEAEITRDGKRFEVEVAEDGTLLEVEEEDEDD